MARDDPFERKQRDASPVPTGHSAAMIRTVMNRSDWAILLILAVIWGGAFMFIGVAVKHVHPLTYVWLRLTIAAAGMWVALKISGGRLGLPREVWGSILLLALLNNALPFTLRRISPAASHRSSMQPRPFGASSSPTFSRMMSA
jgi:hypothetical protein